MSNFQIVKIEDLFRKGLCLKEKANVQLSMVNVQFSNY